MNDVIDKEAFDYFGIHALNYLKLFEPQTLYVDAVQQLDEKLSTSQEEANDMLKNILACKEPEFYVKKGLISIEVCIPPCRMNTITVCEVIDMIENNR